MSDWIKTSSGWKQTSGNGVSQAEFDDVKQDLTHNHYTKSEVDNKFLTVDISNTITKSNVTNSASVKKKAGMAEVVIEFTPTSNGQVLVSNLPSATQYRYYIPAMNFNSGVPINGGVWFDNNTLSYYGTVFNTRCVARFVYMLA